MRTTYKYRIPDSFDKKVGASYTVPTGKYAELLCFSEFSVNGHINGDYFKNIMLKVTPIKAEFVAKAGDVVTFSYTITAPTSVTTGTDYFVKVEVGFYINGTKVAMGTGSAMFTAQATGTGLTFTNYTSTYSTYTIFAKEYGV